MSDLQACQEVNKRCVCGRFCAEVKKDLEWVCWSCELMYGQGVDVQ